MPRKKARKDIVDFSYGMDSTSYPGVISEETTRLPLCENWRIRENGRIVRRGGYQISVTNDLTQTHMTDIRASINTYDIGGTETLPTQVQFIYYGFPRFNTTLPTLKVINVSSGLVLSVLDYNGDTWINNCGRNFINDTIQTDGRISYYTAGPYFKSAPSLRTSGAIIDHPYGSVRLWGIAQPPTAADVTIDGYGATEIPAPTDPANLGWYYFYTYVRLSPIDNSLIAESAPSPIMSARFAPTIGCVHGVAVTKSPDPQVTHVRFYRTTGEFTGFEDGTAPTTAGYIKDVGVSYITTGTPITCDYTEPASIVRLIDTTGMWAYGEYFPANDSLGIAAFIVLGEFVCKYKEQILTYGYDNNVYYTAQRIEQKFKTLFSGYQAFPSKVTGVFVYKNDIIICTIDQTYRVIDGNWEQFRLTVDGIGVVANNSCAFDATSNRTIAITNKGIRAFNGTAWSDDLSYQIKNELGVVTQGSNSYGTFMATAAIINREYILSIRGGSQGSSDALILVGFLNDNGTIGWSIDRTTTPSFIVGNLMTAYLVSNETRVPYNQYPIALMDVNGTKKLIKIGLASDYDFGSDRIVARFKLPRLVHQSLDNNLHPRYLKLIGTLALPYTTPEEVPEISLKASGDNGRVYERVVVTQDMLGGPNESFKYSHAIGPSILSAVIGGYPTGQTECKSNDIIQLTVTTALPMVSIIVLNEGAGTATTSTFAATTTKTINVFVADRGTTATLYPIHVQTKDARGHLGDIYITNAVAHVDGVNEIYLNNTYPTATFDSITYPASQSALKDSETATVAMSYFDADAVSFTSPGSQLSITNATTLAATKIVTRIAGDYNISTNNLKGVFTRTANGAYIEVEGVVNIAHVAATLTITLPAARLRSGGNYGTVAQAHTITITASQELSDTPILDTPIATWLGTHFVGGPVVWTRLLEVHDDDIKGTYSWGAILGTNLAGKTTTSITGTATVELGGFVFRTLNVAAWPNRDTDIGTMVVDTSKLQCTNLSKPGTLNYTYQSGTANNVSHYTIADPYYSDPYYPNVDVWYNCDYINAYGNTGTQQIELEELV